MKQNFPKPEKPHETGKEEGTWATKAANDIPNKSATFSKSPSIRRD